MLLHIPGPGHPQEAGDRVEVFFSFTPGKDLLNHLTPLLHGSGRETEAQRSKDVTPRVEAKPGEELHL